MKKLKIVFVATLLSSGSLLYSMGGEGIGFRTECKVRANSAYNIYHCRLAGEGHDQICMPDGTGPACAETVLTPI